MKGDIKHSDRLSATDQNNLMENDGTVIALLGTEEIVRNDCDNNDAPLDNKNDE